ncbi:MAG: hypothetical protein WBB22_12645 [Anaerolineae bacterium]
MRQLGKVSKPGKRQRIIGAVFAQEGTPPFAEDTKKRGYRFEWWPPKETEGKMVWQRGEYTFVAPTRESLPEEVKEHIGHPLTKLLLLTVGPKLRLSDKQRPGSGRGGEADQGCGGVVGGT